MLKHIFQMMLTATCMLSPAIAGAGVQSADDARKVAADFFMAGNVDRLANVDALTLEHVEKVGGNPSYYVFNASDGNGFIIISADDTAMPVIGYSTTSTWRAKDIPSETKLLIDRVEMPGKSAAAKAPARSARSGSKVLSTATWSQEAPFNNKIPNRRLVGCVGTALAEIIKYHQYPTNRPASLQNAGEATAYDWGNMRTDNYRTGYSHDEAEAVSTLVADAAIAIGTDFGMSSSSAFEVKVPAALVELFGYDAGVSYKKGSEMDRTSWDNLIINEIDEGRPVLYSGQDVSSGHAFVCDGYEIQGQTPYFHINWGWGGSADGFYASNALNPTVSKSHSYNNLTTIVYNIKPATSTAEWSPIHITSDEKQIGMTLNVTDLNPGTAFTVRVGALKNITNNDFSGNISAALFSSDGTFKKLLGDGKKLNLLSLQIINYTDMSFTVPADAAISDGDIVRLVTKQNDESTWLPVASDLITLGEAKAKGYAIPYFSINIPTPDEGAEVVCDNPQVIKGRDFTFKVTATSPDKVVTVKANGFILSPDAQNNYKITNVNSDQDIAIIVQNAADVVSKRNLWVQAGKLSELISDTDAGTIRDLTLFGTIDANDFTFMREKMKLTRLDISGVYIVASGANPANAIPTKAFMNYRSLTQIILPKSLTTFKNGCFGASGLESIEIPASVATYEYNIFANCTRLREVTVRRATAAWVNWCVFTNTPQARLVVPVGATASYMNKEYWKDFKEVVEENPTAATHFNVIVEDVPGVRFIALAENTEVAAGSMYEFTVETNESYGDAIMEMYANTTRLYPNEAGVYSAYINANTLIHADFRQPAALSTIKSPWKITSIDGSVGLVTDVVNVPVGKAFTIRANALSIPANEAAMFYAAALTDKDGRIKEFISPIVTNGSSNFGNLPANFTCQVKDATVREGNLVCIVSSYNKKDWSIVEADNESVTDRISAIGNQVIYHSINMPEKIEGASIQGGATEVVRGMPFTLKVTPVSVDDRINISVNGINKIVNSALANLTIPAVVEDLEIAIQVVPKGSEAFTVVNVREGELAEKIAQCPSRLKVIGVITSDDFAAFRSHAGTIVELDLADVTIKGATDNADAIPTNAFTSANAATPTALKSIILPTNLVRIAASAFNRCTNLTEITIPASVEYVGAGAFATCTSLKKIIVQGNQPPICGMSPFPTTSTVALEVPKGAESLYSTASYWQDLAQSTSPIFLNIQIDPERTFNYNTNYVLTKIAYPTAKMSITLGLPNFKPTSYKANPTYRPGVAFKIFDNERDVTTTSSYIKYGQHGVVFDPHPVLTPADFNYPKDHVINIVFHYPINFDLPSIAKPEMVDLAADEQWTNVDYSLFDENSSSRPTLYREGRDYKFRLNTSESNIELNVVATSSVLTNPGSTEPEYNVTEEVLMADENGIYTITNLQGNVSIKATSKIIIEDGMVMTPDEMALVADEDAKDITSIGVSGLVTETVFEEIREKFESVETLNLSAMTNEEIPANAFMGMENLKSIVIPESVTSVGSNSFAGCTNLKAITLPAVESISENAFDGCSSLTSITILGVGDASASQRQNAPAMAGMNDASFAGINPNCLIFVPEGYDTSLSEHLNVIINTAGTRIAASDIVLDGNHSFNSPASFNLGDYKISLTVDVPGSLSDDKDGWKGIILPFTPTGYEYGVEFQKRGENPLTLLSFDDATAELLTKQDSIVANRPYLANVYAPVDTVPVTFYATTANDENSYDVAYTPTPEEVCATGKNFTLLGSFNSETELNTLYMLNDNGSAFAIAEDEASVLPFSVYMCPNVASAPSSFSVGTHPIWVCDPTSSVASKIYKSSKIELSSKTANAEILYTLDGSDPTDGGTLYTAPFSIPNDSVTVNAIARVKGYSSDMVSLSFEYRKTAIEYPLDEGWSWIAHNVETTLPIENVMVDNVDRMLSMTQEAIRDPKLGVVGALRNLRPMETYKIHTTGNGTKASVNGLSFDPTTPIALHKGWNWIGCPVEDGSLAISDLFKNLEAEEGDMIVSRDGFAQVDAENNWIGTLNALRLGEGYMLLSAGDKELVYNIAAAAQAPAKAPVKVGSSIFQADSRKYPSVMPVISHITYKGRVITDNEEYEIGAFCGDECRGAGVMVNGYMMISVYGNPGDEITFRVHSNVTHAQSDLSQAVTFEESPVGSLSEPYIFDASTSSTIDAVHGDHYEIGVENGTIVVKGDASYVEGVKIYDVAGIKLAEDTHSLSVNGLKRGVYIVVISTDKGWTSHKVELK